MNTISETLRNWRYNRRKREYKLFILWRNTL